MDYCFNGGCWGAVFAVPQSVVDNYIKLADEASIKVLLFVLRNSGRDLPEKDIADALNLNEEQVAKAFTFWENANIFKPSGKKSEHNDTADEKTDDTVQKHNSSLQRRDLSINPTEISERVEKSEDVRVMFSMAEQNFGKPLTYMQQRSLIWMHDYLGLPADVILTLVAYCISIDKGNIGYIEKIASDWNERKINTLEIAQEEIKLLEVRNSFNGRIMKIFEMNRNPTSNQRMYIDDWRAKGYSLELIRYAYEKTVESIDKLSFPYIDKILKTWHEEGITAKEQLDTKKPKKDWQKNKLKEKEPSFDLDDYRSLVNDFGDK